MKRCPQCEFIYEDDQSLCDMDGVLLVFDSQTLPNLHSLATVPALPDRSLRRNRMVPAFATILLTVVIASFYYFSNQTSSAPANNFSPASVTVPPAPPAPTPELNQTQPPVAEPVEPEKPEAPPKSPAKKATTKPATVKAPEPKKEDSKVGSILKKTGKILKKPFRF